LRRALIGVAVLLTITGGIPGRTCAQTVGEDAEMERLRVKAEEAIANDDPDGAAMSIGKAALMASELAKREISAVKGRLYRSAEALFRAQEDGYRALALFRRAGGQAPASTGVCSTLRLAQSHLQHAIKLLDEDRSSGETASDAAMGGRLKQLREMAEDWNTVIASMHTDFQCT
jgi:hypothetical protein